MRSVGDGKDLGVIAQRDFPVGDVILMERPSLKLQVDSTTGQRTTHFAGEQAATIEQLLSLAKNARLPPLPTARTVEAKALSAELSSVVNTNGFTSQHRDRKQLLVFMTISRFNHSCRPSAEMIVWPCPDPQLAQRDPTSDLGVVKAIRPIAAGE